MEGIWVVLSKAAVITWLIVLVSGSILAIKKGNQPRGKILK